MVTLMKPRVISKRAKKAIQKADDEFVKGLLFFLIFYFVAIWVSTL